MPLMSPHTGARCAVANSPAVAELAASSHSGCHESHLSCDIHQRQELVGVHVAALQHAGRKLMLIGVAAPARSRAQKLPTSTHRHCTHPHQQASSAAPQQHCTTISDTALYWPRPTIVQGNRKVLQDRRKKPSSKPFCSTTTTKANAPDPYSPTPSQNRSSENPTGLVNMAGFCSPSRGDHTIPLRGTTHHRPMTPTPSHKEHEKVHAPSSPRLRASSTQRLQQQYNHTTKTKRSTTSPNLLMIVRFRRPAS
mmetsp:Transcript_7351/g.18074  ORF Transcript_7351/g.18074 Transcript_7351/m.18074 type:complete len:252 (-) Transcript_7351:196-951(-)